MSEHYEDAGRLCPACGVTFDVHPDEYCKETPQSVEVKCTGATTPSRIGGRIKNDR
jgi:hypothetical protein